MVVKKLFGLALAFGLVGCGSQNDIHNSDIKITNGIAASQKDFPAVVKLSLYSGWSGGICTGTWVNDHQVITAAHCVYSKPRVSVGNIRAINYQIQDGYDMKTNGGVNELDLAIVNFPAGSAPAVRQIIRNTPAKGAAAKIVGFGNNVIAKSSSGGITGSGAGRLRYGDNILSEMSNNMLQIVGVPKANYDVEGKRVDLGELASTGSGDSGGPIFVNGRLAGVTSGGGVGETAEGLVLAVGLFTDLNSPESQAFLDEHLDR